VILLENQSGFRRGRSCIDNVFALNQIIEKRREFNLETHIAFTDLEKALDRIHKSKVWETLDKRGYPKHLINILINMYETKTKTELGDG
jgi:hypothetical protein